MMSGSIPTMSGITPAMSGPQAVPDIVCSSKVSSVSLEIGIVGDCGKV